MIDAVWVLGDLRKIAVGGFSALEIPLASKYISHLLYKVVTSEPLVKLLYNAP